MAQDSGYRMVCGRLLAAGGLGTLASAVLAASLLPVIHAGSVEGAAHDVVADAGEVLHTAAADEHDGVFLEAVALAGDVGSDFDAVDEADAGHLAEGRVRLLRRLGAHLGAHTALLGIALRAGLAEAAGVRVEAKEEGRSTRLLVLRRASLADELVDGRHYCFPCFSAFSCAPHGEGRGCRA